jgi:glycosyltransferase involved in cell wall biosynthesis
LPDHETCDAAKAQSSLPSNSPRVSVLMLTFNRPQFIGRAIQSVFDQTYRDWELIVVQDGDHALTGSILRDWQARDSRIQYFHREQPGNIANACNYGLARARGEYIAILDDDDYWAIPEKLEKQVSFLDENPEYAACGGGVTVVDEHGSASLTYLKQQQDSEIRRNALYANPMAHSTTMFRKSAANSVGFYEESLAGFQDWDLWLKLGKAGKLYNFPEVFLYYTIWSGGGSFMQSRGNTRSAVQIVRRHMDCYKGSYAALLLAYAYFGYARLPLAIRQRTFASLSRLKKRIFAEGAAPKKNSLKNC